MRRVLPREAHSHLAMGYGAWAPVAQGGRVTDVERDAWLDRLRGIAVPADYAVAFERWKSGFDRPGDRTAELTLKSRMLVGHGNTSGSDVGLTVHHTWGVPIIPGSALKGLVAHFVDTRYGPDDPSVAPWSQEDTSRASWQGVTWNGRRVQRGPGEAYRALFGAPDAEDDEAARAAGAAAGAAAGIVTFHDALYVPDSCEDDKPFAPDVLTVHQKPYYENLGGEWPADYHDPNPVAFLTVRPKTKLLLALSGPSAWTELAAELLGSALKEWGVGAKTSAGYGIGDVGRWGDGAASSALPPGKDAQDFALFVANYPLNAGKTQRELLEQIWKDWLDRLRTLSPADKALALRALRRINSPKLVHDRDRLISKIKGDLT